MQPKICYKLTPEEYEYVEINKPEDYTEFETYCAYCVRDNIYLRAKHIKPGYEDAGRLACEYEDDGFCLNHNKCPHKQAIGYYQCPNGRIVYPLPGEIVLMKNGNFVRYISKEQFMKKFKPV